MQATSKAKTNKKATVVTASAILALLCAISTLLCSGLYLSSEPLYLDLDFKAAKSLTVRCEYTAESSAPFSRELSAETKITGCGDFEQVRISIPCSTVRQVKLLPGETPGEITMRNIRMVTESGVIPLGQNFDFHDTDTHSVQGGNITLQSQQKAPHIIYNKEFCATNLARHIDWFYLLIVVSLSALFWAIVLRHAAPLFRRQQSNDEEMRGSPLFVVTFCVLLVLPWVNVSSETISTAENRALAPRPSLVQGNGGINPAFGKGFDSWLQDHAAFRNSLTSAYFDFKAKLSAVRQTARVTMYSDNWMFSKQYYEAAVTPYTDAELTKMTDNLRRLQDWCRQRNIKLYLLACPTKETLYADFNKSFLNKDMVAVPQLQAHLQTHLPDLPFIYPLAAMQQARTATPGELLHYKSDSHQTEDGAYIMYRETMAAIRKDFADVPISGKGEPHLKLVRNNLVLQRDTPTVNQYYEGGLYHNLDLDDKSVLDTEYNHYECATPGATCTAGAEPMEFHFTFDKGKYSAMLLGDSYSSYQQLWFRYSFQNMWRVRANNGVNGGTMNMKRWESALTQSPPDILILCICSGRLGMHLSALYD